MVSNKLIFYGIKVAFDLEGLRAWMNYFHFMFKLKKNFVSAVFGCGGGGGGGRREEVH